jgi:hypothetical protein
MLTGALTYGLPPQQVSLTFASPLAHPPPMVWTLWMTFDALTYGLPPHQVGPTFAPPPAHPPSVAWTPWMTSSALPYGLPLQQVDPTFTPPMVPSPLASWTPWMSSWNQHPLAHSFNTMTIVPPAVIDWVIDFGASNHTTSSASNLTSV